MYLCVQIPITLQHQDMFGYSGFSCYKSLWALILVMYKILFAKKTKNCTIPFYTLKKSKLPFQLELYISVDKEFRRETMPCL